MGEDIKISYDQEGDYLKVLFLDFCSAKSDVKMSLRAADGSAFTGAGQTTPPPLPCVSQGKRHGFEKQLC
jgi:hypothetical protein